MRAARKNLLGVLALALLVTSAYAPIRSAGFVWDDDSYLTANPTLTQPDGLRRIWLEPRATPQYYPLVFTSFWIEHRLWQFQPAGYHLVNVAIHLGNALLLWLLLARIGFPLAWSAAAVFALHPLQVESVAWITERKNILSGFFYLLAAISYLPVLDQGTAGGPTGDPSRKSLARAWLLALFCFVCALLSKSVTATLPAALLLLAWWRRGRVNRRDVGLLAPFFAVGAASGLFTAWLEKFHVGAHGPFWSLSFDERVVIAGKNIWFYLAKTLWPHPLLFTYPRWQPHGYPIWHLAAPAAALALALLLWRYRSRLGRGPLAAYLFFLVTLAPALGFLDFYPMRFSFVADHFFYLGIIGPILCISGGLALALRLPRSPGVAAVSRFGRGAAAALGALLLLLVALDRERSAVFLDEERLWRDTLLKNPGATSARVNLGTLLARRGEQREALALFQAALAAEPGSADILSNIGSALVSLRRPGEAEASYRAALRSDPDFIAARVGLGSLLQARGEPREATGHFSVAARLSPDSPDIRFQLAAALAAGGDSPGAVREYEEGLRRNPRDAAAHVELGTLLAVQGVHDPAADHFRQALALDPSNRDARYNLGKIMDARGEVAQAITLYREVLRLDPMDAEALNNLGVDLALTGQRQEAAARFREALQVRPGYREATVNLEALRSPAGQD